MKSTTITIIMCYQMWRSSDGCSIAGVNGRGIGVRPMIFFKDNKRVASAQESAVLVSAHYTRLHVQVYMYVYVHSSQCLLRYGTSTMDSVFSDYKALLTPMITVSSASISLKITTVSLLLQQVDLLL